MDIDLQLATVAKNVPEHGQFLHWCATTMNFLGKSSDTELTIRLADNAEIRKLNHDYRGKDKPTNVLSFPFEPYDALIAYAGDAAEINLLGDIVIAPAVIAREAEEQKKSLINHYAHMTIHGVLHLLGYDHVEDDEAEEMERLEVAILAALGIDNPYDNDAPLVVN